MGQGSRKESRRALTLIAVAAIVGPAVPVRADPIWQLPPLGEATLVGGEKGEGSLALTAEVSGFGVLGAENMTTFPELEYLDGDEPELGTARVGLVGRHAWRPWAWILRGDFSEGLRVGIDGVRDQPLAGINRYIDDAAVWWIPKEWVRAWAGRGKVPFSRFRHLERALLTAGAVPFVVDRVAPDRRWGAALFGDLGAIAYAAGAYADNNKMELRAGDDQIDDPSRDGRMAFAGHVEWTPRAPIGGDHQPTSSKDPWRRVVRVSSGMGFLWRWRKRGGPRLDLSLNGQIKWRRLAAVAELLVARDRDGFAFTGGAIQASVLVTDKVTVFSRGDYDHTLDLWSGGGGASFFVTSDRRSKVTFVGWYRRDRVGGPRRDGAVVQLQAWL
jgi:hypothetical protein